MCRRYSRLAIVAACLGATLLSSAPARAEELSAELVLNSIDRAKRFLVSRQADDGSWTMGNGQYTVGVSSLAILALINAGMTVEDEPVERGLKFLRSAQEPHLTYEMSTMIMALAAAKDGTRDKARILSLAQKLEDSQITVGGGSGSWTYSKSRNADGDRSNAQFAVLGLRDAVHAGVPVSRRTWERVRRHWVLSQSSDGGWGYRGMNGNRSSGSMTTAGIATMVIVNSMLRDDSDVRPDGKPICCTGHEPDETLANGIQWLRRHFSVRHNPQGSWLLYYLYAMERAGRLSGRRFFGDHDWYREGADFLISQQSKRWGGWIGVGGAESDPVLATSFALLFLSKGLAPVLINKLMYGPPDKLGNISGDHWNLHPYDVRNLVDHITGLPKWPKLITWQTVELPRAVRNGGASVLLQAPILYLNGKKAPTFSNEEVQLLRDYVTQGGFIFAVASCQSAEFDDGFRQLVRQLYPDGQADLKLLPPEHPIFRAEYLLDPETVDLWGVDVGCRTAIVYSPEDVSCLWNKWMWQPPPDRHATLKSMISRANKIGVNVVAYAAGRELLNKLERDGGLADDGEQDRIQRGLLQVAKLRHTGGWDAAPRALRNLLAALNRTVGLAASTERNVLPATDPDLFKYPIVYMHGRYRFNLSQQEREQLKLYLERGGLLFADACCGARQFDQSFRDAIDQMFPGKSLQRIPVDHELFNTQTGFDIRRVKLRAPEVDDPNRALRTGVREGEPLLEGLKIDGRYAVIYSPYDISCALEKQASVACVGYESEDALKIAINVILYAMLQDVRYSPFMK